MKRFYPVIIAALALCLFAGSVYAGGEPMTSKGDRQLVFRFEGLSYLGLNSYFRGPGGMCDDDEDCIDHRYTCGGGFGMRYFIEDGRAMTSTREPPAAAISTRWARSASSGTSPRA